MNWFEFIDYIFKGVVLAGGAYLFYFMRNSYEREIANYKIQIDVLKETQVDKYLDRMKKFKELYENMIADKENEMSLLKQEMDNLSKQHLTKDEIIESQKQLIDKFKNKIYDIFNESWELYLKNSPNYIEIKESYADILEFKPGRFWTIKFRDPKMKKLFERPIGIDDNEK